MTSCSVCPHNCKLSEGKLGICGTRTAQGDRIVSLNYGQATALALDPVEKKPFACFHPGTMILSYGSYGCNMRCAHCQNSEISTATATITDCKTAASTTTGTSFAESPATEGTIPTSYFAPEELVELALSLRDRGNIGIAFTYNEPLIAPEYLTDVARPAHANGLLTAAVTNAYTSEATLTAVLPHLDALNIDLKCFSEEGYRRLGAPGGLETVKRSITLSVEAGVHVELTTLVVPELSDDAEAFERECAWIAALDSTIPLHITRFFPAHKAHELEATTRKTLEDFRDIALGHLHSVYLGNI